LETGWIGTYDFDSLVPRSGSEQILLYIVPVHTHDLRRVFMPSFDG
jgi:hypothetical protein